MDIIEKARELGRLIQEEDSYKKLQDAQKNADADMELQRLIGEFNLKRMSINNEASKKERDQEKLSKLNTEMREAYSQIMSNENSVCNNIKSSLCIIVGNHILAIVQQSAEGADPETADYSQSSCSGSCATCGGCG